MMDITALHMPAEQLVLNENFFQFYVLCFKMTIFHYLTQLANTTVVIISRNTKKVHYELIL